MTNEDVLHLLNSYTQNELRCRDIYYRSNSENHTVPPLPENIDFVPETLTPQALLRRECNVIPYWHERYVPNEYHDHQFVELMYQFSGSCSNTIEGTTSLLQGNDVCILPPGVYHLPEIYDDQSIMMNLLINTETFFGVCQKFKLGDDHPLSQFVDSVQYSKTYPKYYYSRSCSSKVRDLMCEILIEYIENQAYSDLVIENLLTNILCELFRTPAEQVELSQQLISSTQPILPILQYVYNNFKTVTLEELSELFSYTPQHLCRMFKLHTGNSFGRYLLEIRLTRAKHLLINTDFTVGHIATLSGFDCIPYFHRKFKNEVGCSPNEFRHRMAERPQESKEAYT
ncbi:MAG: helix-turn-helix domain-containing protein [Clostridia bacterium]|nr:helix-turn-helix domain-containing protein [Clostridia bacterium]